MDKDIYRNFEVSLKEAREWVKSNNPTLRNIAVKCFTAKELTEIRSLKELIDLYENTPNFGTITSFDSCGHKELLLHRYLLMLADQFNGSWERTSGNTGYFIRYDYRHNPFKKDSDFIGCHHSVIYPGIVYFETKENALKAFKILKKAGYKFD